MNEQHRPVVIAAWQLVGEREADRQVALRRDDEVDVVALEKPTSGRSTERLVTPRGRRRPRRELDPLFGDTILVELRIVLREAIEDAFVPPPKPADFERRRWWRRRRNDLQLWLSRASRVAPALPASLSLARWRGTRHLLEPSRQRRGRLGAGADLHDRLARALQRS